MSIYIKSFLNRNPLLIYYAQEGLINISSLAHYISKSDKNIGECMSTPAISMFIRRYLSKLPRNKLNQFNNANQPLNIITRTGLKELIFNKTVENRNECLKVFQKISNTKYFSCLVEGEKELVLITDHPLINHAGIKSLKGKITHQTDNLGLISIDFSIDLRKTVGVYNYVTGVLSAVEISIQSFHTIGGEIIILVKNEDLLKSNEVLSKSLQ